MLARNRLRDRTISLRLRDALRIVSEGKDYIMAQLLKYRDTYCIQHMRLIQYHWYL